MSSWRMAIFWERTYFDQRRHQDVWIFGCLWTDHHQCCGKNYSKPPFSTNLKLIHIQHCIRCSQDQCHAIKAYADILIKNIYWSKEESRCVDGDCGTFSFLIYYDHNIMSIMYVCMSDTDGWLYPCCSSSTFISISFYFTIITLFNILPYKLLLSLSGSLIDSTYSPPPLSSSSFAILSSFKTVIEFLSSKSDRVLKSRKPKELRVIAHVDSEWGGPLIR